MNYNESNFEKGHAIPISSHSFASGVNYIRHRENQKPKMVGLDQSMLFNYYKTSPKLSEYNTMIVDSYDILGEQGAQFATLVVTVLNDYLSETKKTISSTTHTTGSTILTTIKNPFGSLEVVNHEGDIVSLEDLRAGVVSLDDINYHLTKGH